MSDTFDVTRATAIIEHGIAHGMIETMPQSDGDKIMEAEKLVELARQVEVVRAAWIANGGEEVAREHVPMWPVAEEILVEANLFVGSNDTSSDQQGGSNVTAPQDSSASTVVAIVDQPKQEATVEVPDNLPSTPPPSDGPEEREPPEPASSASTPDAPPSHIRELDGTGISDFPADKVTPRESSVFPGEPVKDEVWADASGTEWLVLVYNGGPSAEVMKVSTGESTVAPAGMLKRLVSPTIDPSPAAVAAQEDHEQEEAAPETNIATGEPDYDKVGVVVTPDPEKPDEQHSWNPEHPLVRLDAAIAKSISENSAPDYDDEGDEEYQRILEETERRYFPSDLPVPHHVENPPPFISVEDLVDVDDLPARTLHSQYNALAARVKLLYSVENARARDCARARKLSLRGPMREAREVMGSSSTVAEREAWAEDNHPELATWSDRVHKHTEEAKAYEMFFGIYTENVSVLSRDWTMRDKQMKP